MILSLATLINSIILCLIVALSVGFYTLIERNVLAYIQLRNGPNNVSISGLPQPLSDALNLFTKENSEVTWANNIIYLVSPLLSILIITSLWIVYTTSYSSIIFNLSILFFICVSSLNVYSILLAGWSSNSNYALLGSIRAIAQTISYEVTITIIIITTLLLSTSLNLETISAIQNNIWFLIIIPSVFAIWIISSLAETNRAPFDLAEGESELVSGFNIEYGSGEFAFLFIAEYGSILFISLITTTLFIKGSISGIGIISLINFILIIYTFLWVRGSFPRIRYDTLIELTWKYLLSYMLTVLLIVLPIINI